MKSKSKYTLIDKLAYELYVEAANNQDRNVFKGYITPDSDKGFQSFVEDHKIYNNCYGYYNDKSIIQKIRKEKLKKINENNI